MPRMVVMMKPEGSFRPGMIHLAITPATKPMMMVQRMLMLRSLVCVASTRNAHPRLRLRRDRLPKPHFIISPHLRPTLALRSQGEERHESCWRPLELRGRPSPSVPRAGRSPGLGDQPEAET